MFPMKLPPFAPTDVVGIPGHTEETPKGNIDRYY